MADQKKTRAEMLLNDPVNEVIPRMAVPTVISMLVTTLYNMADTFFVGRINTAASGSIGIVFSVMTFIQAMAFTFGIGAGINSSHSLGSGDRKKAQTFVSTGFILSLSTGIIVAIITLSNLHSLVMFLGATETIAPHAEEYAKYIMLAAPFTMGSFFLNNTLRYEGLANLAMIGIASGGILNIALDPVFIFGLGMGTGGAGLATAISQCIGFSILLIIRQTKAEAIHITPKAFTFDTSVWGRIIYNGFPSLGRQGIASVSTMLLNNLARPYGDAAIAAISIMNRYLMFINSAVIGFGQGFQPVCSFCFGAKRFKRVKAAFWFSFKVMTVILIVLGGVSFLLSGHIIAVFRNDPEVIKIGTLSLRLQLATLPLWGFVVMSNMFTQSIGYGVQSTIISTARQGIFFIPLIYILSARFGLFGLQLAPPISDICTLILALIMVPRILKQLESKDVSQEE